MNTTTQTTGTSTLAIDGMTCGHCVQAVTKALSAVPGVKVQSVAVGSAVIQTADGWAAGKALNALDEAGYPAKVAGDGAGALSPSPAKTGGGCCVGGADITTDRTPSVKRSGGCCG